MQIISDPKEIQALCGEWRCRRQTLGFVPTMGALHDGHLELCRHAREQNDNFIASIFVNPSQFGPKEDLSRYPRPFERDCELLREAGCDALFAPDAETMYGKADFLHGTWVDVTPFDEMWEGVTRPGHLRGVATIVTKLFNIVHPNRAYFGEKDFQQLRVVQALVHDLNFNIEICPVETLRESDGLARSSRNAYLSNEERQKASVIYRAMQCAIQMAKEGETDVRKLGIAMENVFATVPELQTQYVSIVDAQTLSPLEILDGRPARILVAAYLGRTRLIDNLPI
jgi:pantoate--beta-alanine ligase